MSYYASILPPFPICIRSPQGEGWKGHAWQYANIKHPLSAESLLQTGIQINNEWVNQVFENLFITANPTSRSQQSHKDLSLLLPHTKNDCSKYGIKYGFWGLTKRLALEEERQKNED